MPNNAAMEHKSPVVQAIELAGGLSRLAALIGVKPPTVHEWKTGERQVPAERCMEIEAAVKGGVTCEQLRPDLKWHVVRGTAGPALSA
jgi:DNA-binding transcriptional regulator YdaS (Cro superfamily)